LDLELNRFIVRAYSLVYTGCANKKFPRKKFCIFARTTWISAKLSEFVRENSRNISCKFY